MDAAAVFANLGHFHVCYFPMDFCRAFSKIYFQQTVQIILEQFLGAKDRDSWLDLCVRIRRYKIGKSYRIH